MENQQMINIKGKSYIAKFPTVGQLMDIESMKMTMSNGKYTEMALSPLKVHTFQLDVIDAISYFSVLIPELKTDLGIKSWKDLEASVAKEIMSHYKSQFIPWYKPIFDDLLKVDKDDEPTGNSNDISQ